MEAWRRSGRYGDGIAGPGDYSANMEARRSFLRGLWRLSTRPSVTRLKNLTKNCLKIQHF